MQIEVELLLFRENLEDKGGLKADIDEKVKEERERLLSQRSQVTDAAEQPSTSNRCVSAQSMENAAHCICKDEFAPLACK